MKNIGQYNQDLSVPRKKDIDSLETRVKTNEDNIAMAESDIEGLNTDVGTLKTDVSNVKTALSSKQDTITGAASTIVDDNLTANKVLVSDAGGKVGAASVGIDDINPDGKYLKLSGGYVTGPVGLWGGVTGPLTVKNGAVKLNEGYSIGYGDGNYIFTQISGNFQISKGGSSQGVYIASGTDGTNGTLSMYVNNDAQNASTSIRIKSNGVISLSAEDSSSGSFMVNNVRVTGVADGTADKDAVNLSQLKQYSVLSGTITVSNITGNFAGETDMLLFAIRCSGDITSVKGTDGTSQEYAELLYINGNDSMFGSPSFSYDIATKKITLSFIGTYKTAPTTLELKCLFRV